MPVLMTESSFAALLSRSVLALLLLLLLLHLFICQAVHLLLLCLQSCTFDRICLVCNLACKCQVHVVYWTEHDALQRKCRLAVCLFLSTCRTVSWTLDAFGRHSRLGSHSKACSEYCRALRGSFAVCKMHAAACPRSVRHLCLIKR